MQSWELTPKRQLVKVTPRCYLGVTCCDNINGMSCMKMFEFTAGVGKEAAVFFLLVWRWVKVENAVSLSLENACTNIRSCGKWYAYYYLLLPPTAECQLPLSFPEPPFYSKEVFVCNKMPLTFAWLVEIKSMTLCDIQMSWNIQTKS